MNCKKLLLLLCYTTVPFGAIGSDLTATASVNITSETAAMAKDMAFNDARRQIIADVLGQYSIPDQLAGALQTAKNSELTNLIASSSISGEKQSDTTYSADITMTVDGAAARAWMTENNVQNWLGDGKSGDVFVTQVVMSDKLARWIELNQIVRDNDIDMTVKYINGNQITVEIPSGSRAKFTASVRAMGWRYADQNGVLHIIK